MNKPITLGVVTTHPIQYQVPLFRDLQNRSGVQVEVFYERIPSPDKQGKGFGEAFEWDLPLLQGYSWKVLRENVNRQQDGYEGRSFTGFGQAYRNVDVMLIHGWQSAYMRRAWLNGLWGQVPLLVRGESNAMRSRPWYLQGLHRMYVRPFDRYLYIGEGNRRFYRNAGVPSSALYFAPYCIENERFDVDWQNLKTDRADVRVSMGIEKDTSCFLFCGKFIGKKRPTDVVRAFMRAQRATESSMHLLMVGDGELRLEAKAQVPDEAPVTFTGFLNQTEIGRAYAAADALVLPSDYGETWGLVVNEGMIFECPAIVSDRVGCGPDLIEDGETGYTVPFADTEALADTMVRVAERPARTRTMGKQARELVLSEYTIERAADGIARAARDAYSDNA